MALKFTKFQSGGKRTDHDTFIVKSPCISNQHQSTFIHYQFKAYRNSALYLLATGKLGFYSNQGTKFRQIMTNNKFKQLLIIGK